MPHLQSQILLYVVDGAGGDKGGSGGNEPASDLKSLYKELKLYDEGLLQKPAMLFVNKSDLECKMSIELCSAVQCSALQCRQVMRSGHVFDGIDI